MRKFTEATFHKAPKAYPVDFFTTDYNGVVTAGVEVKVRNYELKKLPDLFISAHKLQRMAEFYATTNIKTYLLVQALDGLFYTHIDLHRLHFWTSQGCVRMAGRKDRDDWQDIEPCFHIPISDFQFRAA